MVGVQEHIHSSKINKETNAMSTINLDNKTILVTGAAGFIGSNLVKRIYQEAPSATVIGMGFLSAG